MNAAGVGDVVGDDGDGDSGVMVRILLIGSGSRLIRLTELPGRPRSRFVSNGYIAETHTQKVYAINGLYVPPNANL